MDHVWVLVGGEYELFVVVMEVVKQMEELFLDFVAPGEELVMLLRCEPLPLYSILERNGFGYRSKLRPDGTNEITIQKA